MVMLKDTGKTWNHIGLENVGQIGAVEIHPEDPNTLYVAAIGQPFNKNEVQTYTLSFSSVNFDG